MGEKTKIFIEKVNKLYPSGEYSYHSGEYVNNKTKLEMKHNTCGHIWSITPVNFLKGRKCPVCAKKIRANSRRLSVETIDSRILEQVGNEYTRIGEFINVDTKLEMKHNVCGHTWEVSMNMFLGSKQRRCPKCAKVLKKDNKIFQENIDLVYGEGQFTLLSEYTNINSDVTLRHEICGETFETNANNFLYKKRGCKCCKGNKSLGEIMVANILESLGLEYKEQVSFKGFYINKKSPFKYDFQICGTNVLIEYDGIQHFKPVEFFGGEAKFLVIKERDRMKDEYCKKNNYNLIRIPYYMKEDEVKSYIVQRLSKSHN